MITRSSVTVSFTITSTEMPLERMAEILPFTPSKCWREGDTIGNSIIRRKHNGVIFSLPQKNVDDIEPVVLELLDTLEPIKDELIVIISNFPIECELSCAVFFAQPPSCNLSADTIKRLAELEIAFDLDLIPSDIP